MMKKFNLLTLMAAGAITHAAASEPMTAYLFAYFEGTGGQTEHLRFAVSDNGFDWHALSCNDPVILSDTIAVSGGTRDHHILRGADGKTFYMVATDMQTKKYGWVENPGVVLMKSDNLTDWTHATVELAKAFPENFSDAYWVWAPQTIYDPDEKKYMVYFTVRRQDASKGFTTYYAYANNDFTAFESEPRVLYRTETGCIDNDIMQGPDGRWYMFYKANEGEQKENGIKLAIADKLHGPWVEQPGFVDAYAGNPPVEGSGIFRLNDTGEYVLMYDLYTSGRYEYQTSKDLIHFTREAKAFTKDFFPRHGTVMPITASEKRRIEEKWTCDTTQFTNPILPGFHADPEVLFSEQTGKYYIYSTTDGTPGWGGHNFQVFSSDDIDSGDWKDEGVMLELEGDQVKWASGNAWAPAIIERKEGNGYKYYFYFSGHNPTTNRKEIGVAVASHPTGPFIDL
ncbi:MAG: family 43 glycosylhydrolase, partial [Muribaculaceae bacterium]|nr:family 43 glycosylhydrolase [Muribaculaceae bacterium]